MADPLTPHEVNMAFFRLSLIQTSKLLLVLVSAVIIAACSSNTKKDTAEDDFTDTMADSEPTVSTPVAAPAPVRVVNTFEDADTVFYFDFDQAVLRADARDALLIHAERLKTNPESVRLEGHADERGSREYNMALGERRANAVRDFLVIQGVDRSLIETISYGEERPQRMGSSPQVWSMNRRVEMK